MELHLLHYPLKDQGQDRIQRSRVLHFQVYLKRRHGVVSTAQVDQTYVGYEKKRVG